MAVRSAPPRSPKVPEIRKGDTSSCSPARTPASAARSSGSSAARRRRARPQRLPPRLVAGGVSVVVEGLNIAKRHTKPRQSAGRDRPHAEDAAGRHPRDRPAPADQQGDARLPELRQADPHRPRDARRRSPRPRLPPLRRAAGGEVVTSRLQRALHGRGRARAPEAVRVRQPDAGAAAQQDRRQHRPGRGADQRQGARRGRSAT